MTTEAIFHGQKIDLAHLSPPLMAAMWDLYTNHPRRKERMPLACVEHGGALYLKNVAGELLAAHYPNPGSPCSCPKGIRLQAETPEHRHMKLYAYRAFDEAGYTAQQEFTTEGRTTRVDTVALDSPTPLGVEAQWSGITKSEATRRTNLSYRNSGLLSVWLPGTAEVAGQIGANVPILRHNDGGVDWRHDVPDKSKAIATSVRRMRAVKCTSTAIEFDKCPVTGSGPCGLWHPWWNDQQEYGWYTLNDALVGLAAGELLALQDFKRVTRIVPVDDLAAYQNLTNHDGLWLPDERDRQPLQASRSTVCKADRKPDLDLTVNQPVLAVEAPPSSPVLHRPAAAPVGAGLFVPNTGRIAPTTVTYRAVDDHYCAFTWTYNENVLQAFKSSVPRRHRRWDKSTRQWCVHRAYAQPLAAKLARLGCRVQEIPTPAPLIAAEAATQPGKSGDLIRSLNGLIKSSSNRRCTICGLALNPAFGITAHYDCASKAANK